jgi:hypothetical protein
MQDQEEILIVIQHGHITTIYQLIILKQFLQCWEADGARTVLRCWKARSGEADGARTGPGGGRGADGIQDEGIYQICTNVCMYVYEGERMTAL